jgi:precorrin-6B methylase 2
MPISDRDLDYLASLKAPSQAFGCGLFRGEVRRLEALLGVEIPPQAILPLFSIGVSGRRRMALSRLGLKASEQVSRGPFEGLKLAEDHRIGELSVAKLLGVYEHELRAVISATDHWERVVNIGSAEGYYAVGFARRVPERRVTAYDIDANAQTATTRTAALNEVADRVTVLSECTPEASLEHADAGALFWIDIEGAERELLSTAPPARLAGSDLLVETHFQSGAFTGLAVARHFQETHDITVIRQSEIQPDEVPEFLSLAPLDRHLIMLEHTTPAPWLWMRGRGARR